MMFAPAILACAGRLEGGMEEVEREGPTAADVPVDGELGSAGASPGSGFRQMPLGSCSGGWTPGEDPPGKTCDWLAEGQCYLTKDDACACICPRAAGTICLSDFPGVPGSRKRVTCHEGSD